MQQGQQGLPGGTQGGLPQGMPQGLPQGMPQGAQQGSPQGGQQGMPGRAGGPGGLLQGSEPSAELTALLEQDADSYTWVAAAVGSNAASGYQLATGAPVMAIGGFNGSDPSPSLTQFQQYVTDGQIHWFIAGNSGGPGGMAPGGDTRSQISEWVQQNFEAVTVDDVTLYDLSAG